jgi:uncharacterized metal-binding protein
MEKIFVYLVFIGIIIFGVNVSLNWNISVESQIGVGIFTCGIFVGLIVFIVSDIRDMIKKRIKRKRKLLKEQTKTPS